MNVCQRPDYLEAIYDNERRNRFPQSACSPGYNLSSEAFCTLPPSFVAQPFLTLNQSTGDLQLRDALNQSLPCKGNCRKGPASAILDACDAQFNRPLGYSRMESQFSIDRSRDENAPNREKIVSVALEQMKQGYQPWSITREATRKIYNRNGCEPCNLVLSCGPTGLASGCCGRGLKRQRLNVCKTDSAVPVLQMPNMDLVEFADGDSHEVRPFYFDTPISQLDAAGSNNPFLSRFASYAFQAEKKRELREYGIGTPPFPKPCPPTPVGVAPRYDVPSKEAQMAQPIVLNSQALFRSDNCGCNRSECRGGPGTTCTKCFKTPQSIAGIYARQSK